MLPDLSNDRTLASAQLARLCSHSSAAALLSTIFAVVLAHFLSTAVPATHAWGWLFAKAIVALARLVHIKGFGPTITPDPVKKLRTAVGLLAFDGLIWGVGGWWLISSQTHETVIIVACLTCIASIGTFGLQTCWQATAAYVIPMLAPLLWGATIAGGRTPALAAVGCSIAGLLMLRTAYQATRDLRTLLAAQLTASQASASLTLALDDANTRREQQAMWLATVNHDLRNPVHAIVLANRMLRNLPHSQEHARYLKLQENAAGMVQRLLNDLLDTAKLEAGTLSIELEDHNVVEWLEEISQLTRLQAANAALTFTHACQIHGDVCAAFDAGRVRQVLENLLTNAIKFTPPGGVIELQSELLNDALVLRVTDTGPGIDPEAQVRLFTPFSQFGSASTRRSGAGLGLSIAKRLIEHMGGQIGVRSSLNRGATFSISMPVTRINQGSKNECTKVSVETSWLDPARYALVVDDDPVCLILQEAQLKVLGYSTKAATRGEAAVDAVQSDVAPDIILMDCDMPGMGGFAAASAIRAWCIQEGRPQPTLIAVSGRHDHAFHERALESGFAAMLPKPHSQEALIAVLRNAVHAGTSDSKARVEVHSELAECPEAKI